jgi:hypothetical protein
MAAAPAPPQPLPLQPPIVAHLLLDRLTLSIIEAAATIGGTEFDAPESTLTVELTV